MAVDTRMVSCPSDWYECKSKRLRDGRRTVPVRFYRGGRFDSSQFDATHTDWAMEATTLVVCHMYTTVTEYHLSFTQYLEPDTAP